MVLQRILLFILRSCLGMGVGNISYCVTGCQAVDIEKVSQHNNIGGSLYVNKGYGTFAIMHSRRRIIRVKTVQLNTMALR